MVGEVLSEEDKIKERCNLISKIFNEQCIIREMIKEAMGKVWWLSKFGTFKEVRENMFIITFATETDKLRVVNGKS